MAHTLKYNSDTHAIELTAQGQITFDEQKEIFAEAVRMSIEKNCKLFLSDYRKAILMLSTGEIYDLPKILSDIVASSGMTLPQFRRAVVVENDLKDYQFFETVTANSGQNAKVFYDVSEAKKWLFGK